MRYLNVANWDKFQHYKDRNPPWIKCHTSLLRDYDFARLPDASKAHLMLIWLLASSSDNCLPADTGWIAKQIGCGDDLDLSVLIDAGFLTYDASWDLALCEQDACLEEEAEAEAELESKTEAKARQPRRDGKAELDAAIETWDSEGDWLLGSDGVRAAEAYRVCRSKRRAAMWERDSWLSLFMEAPSPESLIAALDKSTQSKWLSVHPKSVPASEKSITDQMRDTAKELGI